jgi:hypothetical protein
LDSDNPFCGVEHHHIKGERGAPYPQLLQQLQMAHCTNGPPCEENQECWLGEGSESHPLMLIPIEDVVVDPLPSSSEEGEYHKAPVESGGITNVDNKDLHQVDEELGSD